MNLINIVINNRPVSVRSTATILQACDSVGVDVPRFCYHESLSVAGNCRICLVEVHKSPKPVVACARPVSPNIVIYTNTPLVRKAREAVLEFLLLHHPLDCPICDQGGECDLQDEAIRYGSDRGRTTEFKRSVEDADTGPVVKRIITRCIHCTRCVRFASEVAGLDGLGAFGRGEIREIGTYLPNLIRTELSGNLVDLCPVGALTSKPYAYTARRWELTTTETLDPLDAIGVDIVVQTRSASSNGSKTTSTATGGSIGSIETLLRILPRNNGRYREVWLSDRSRYGFEGLRHSRVLQPLYSEVGASVKSTFAPARWSEILPIVARRFIAPLSTSASAKSPVSFLGGHINVEEIFATLNFVALIGWSSPRFTGSNGVSASSLNVDHPSNWSFQHDRSSTSFLSTIVSCAIVGSNIRSETSLFNTILRREQIRRGIRISFIRPFRSQRLRRNHIGSTFRSLLLLIENRTPSTLQIFNERTSFFIGETSLHSYHGDALQAFSYFLGHRLLTGIPSDRRYGTVHSTRASRAYAALGFGSNQKSQSIYNEIKNSANRVLVHSNGLSRRVLNEIKNRTTFLTIGTHVPENVSSRSAKDNFVIPTTSLYERDGHFLTLNGIGGTRRRHIKAVSAPSGLRTVDVFWSTFARRQGSTTWRRWNEVLGALELERPRSLLLDKPSKAFSVQAFSLAKRGSIVSTPASFITPSNDDIYINDPITLNSPTIGEASIFLNSQTSFYREI